MAALGRHNHIRMLINTLMIAVSLIQDSLHFEDQLPTVFQDIPFQVFKQTQSKTFQLTQKFETHPRMNSHIRECPANIRENLEPMIVKLLQSNYSHYLNGLDLLELILSGQHFESVVVITDKIPPLAEVWPKTIHTHPINRSGADGLFVEHNYTASVSVHIELTQMWKNIEYFAVYDQLWSNLIRRLEYFGQSDYPWLEKFAQHVFYYFCVMRGIKVK